MYSGGFILDEQILTVEVPTTFIEPKGTFKEYLREYYVKDGKVLFHLNRKGDNAVQYEPSEIEIELWIKYFGIDNFVNFYEHLELFKDATISDNNII